MASSSGKCNEKKMRRRSPWTFSLLSSYPTHVLRPRISMIPLIWLFHHKKLFTSLNFFLFSAAPLNFQSNYSSSPRSKPSSTDIFHSFSIFRASFLFAEAETLRALDLRWVESVVVSPRRRVWNWLNENHELIFLIESRMRWEKWVGNDEIEGARKYPDNSSIRTCEETYIIWNREIGGKSSNEFECFERDCWGGIELIWVNLKRVKSSRRMVKGRLINFWWV